MLPHRRGCFWLLTYTSKLLAASYGTATASDVVRLRAYGGAMGRKVDIDDLVDAQEVARIVGLAYRNMVSEYQAKYTDMPRSAVDLGRGRSRLWLRQEVERWHSQQVAAGRTRPKRSAPR